MSLFRLASFLLCSLLVSASVAAQQPPQRDPQGVAILQQSFVAMGGAVSRSVHTAVFSGRIAQQRGPATVQGTVIFKLADRDKWRMDSPFGAETQTHVVNGTKGREVRDGQSRGLPYHTVLNHHMKFVPVFSELAEYANLSYTISYLGLEVLAGHNVHHIRIARVFPGRPQSTATMLSQLSAVDLFVDASSLLVVKRSQQVSSSIDSHTRVLVEQLYSDYRSADGILFPQSISVLVRGQRLNDIVFTSATFNAPISPTEFEVP